mgnify:CR=1 FL=1
MDIKDKFNDAQKRVHTLTQRPSNEQLLTLYALYKQATEGDVHGNRPGMLDFKGRAKYDAWASQKGLPQTEAMQQYIHAVNKLFNA